MTYLLNTWSNDPYHAVIYLPKEDYGNILPRNDEGMNAAESGIEKTNLTLKCLFREVIMICTFHKPPEGWGGGRGIAMEGGLCTRLSRWGNGPFLSLGESKYIPCQRADKLLLRFIDKYMETLARTKAVHEIESIGSVSNDMHKNTEDCELKQRIS